MRIRLREVRESKFLSQDELSERSGITKANISRIEQGKQEPRGSTVRALAAALGVEPSEIAEHGPVDKATDHLDLGAKMGVERRPR